MDRRRCVFFSVLLILLWHEAKSADSFERTGSNRTLSRHGIRNKDSNGWKERVPEEIRQGVIAEGRSEIRRVSKSEDTEDTDIEVVEEDHVDLEAAESSRPGSIALRVGSGSNLRIGHLWSFISPVVFLLSLGLGFFLLFALVESPLSPLPVPPLPYPPVGPFPPTGTYPLGVPPGKHGGLVYAGHPVRPSYGGHRFGRRMGNFSVEDQVVERMGQLLRTAGISYAEFMDKMKNPHSATRRTDLGTLFQDIGTILNDGNQNGNTLSDQVAVETICDTEYSRCENKF